MRYFAFLALMATACAPDFVDQPWLVTGPKVIAVVAEPPEVRPGASAKLSVMVASPTGTLTDVQAAWSLCTDPKPFTENGPVSTSCLADPGTSGQIGASVTLQIGSDACSLFGPDTPPGNFRPRDPDATGGYYQPVAVRLDGTTSFEFERLLCSPAGVSNTEARKFASTYSPNRNPIIAGLSASVGGQAVDFEQIPAGTTVMLTAEWSAESVEAFPIVDVESQALVSGSESMEVSWFATAGMLTTARTGTRPEASATDSANTWIAPPASTAGFLWIVLRDSRGGATTMSQPFKVLP